MTEKNQSYPKGSQVLIKGLQSEAGKKLNGSHGVVQSELVETGDGTWRYPVLIYATLDETTGTPEILPSPNKKAIKEQNLEINPEQNTKLLELAAWKYLEGKTVNNPKKGREKDDHIYFWIWQYHTVRPDDHFVGVQYACLLWTMDKKVKEALEVAKSYLPVYPPDHETYPNFFKDLCSMVTEAGDTDILEVLLYLAIKSQSDKALKRLEEACLKLIQKSPTFENPGISDVHIRACKELLKLNKDGRCIMALAKAYGKAGDHMESARTYRRLLAADELAPPGVEAVRGFLVLSQLQCPGQPLENKFVVQVTRGNVYAVNASDSHNLEKVPQETGEVLLKIRSDDVQATMVPLPSDPDDTTVFPVSLLEQLKP